MIAKVRKGAGFGGVLRYLYGPGQHEEHTDPHRVGGTVIGDDPRSLAQELRASAALNERVTKPVAHYPLALPEGERLSDEQWGRAAHVFMERMGYVQPGSDGFNQRDAPYVVVRHGDDHAHVVASRVRHDGAVVRDSFDYERSHQAARAVEDRFGLSRPPERGRDLAQVTRSERESAQRRQVAPERDRLRQALSTARDSCDGTRGDFEAKARENGALLRANEAKTGKMNGYSASLEGWTDQEGEQIWMPTSKAHRQLRWNQLEHDLERRRETARETEERAVEPARNTRDEPQIPGRDEAEPERPRAVVEPDEERGTPQQWEAMRQEGIEPELGRDRAMPDARAVEQRREEIIRDHQPERPAFRAERPEAQPEHEPTQPASTRDADAPQESEAGRAMRESNQRDAPEQTTDGDELRRLQDANFPAEARHATDQPPTRDDAVKPESEAGRALRQSREREQDRGHER